MNLKKSHGLLLAFILLLCITLSFAACKGKKKDNNKKPTTTTVTTVAVTDPATDPEETSSQVSESETDVTTETSDSTDQTTGSEQGTTVPEETTAVPSTTADSEQTTTEPEETTEQHVCSFGDWRESQPATCIEGGVRIRECSCGNFESEAIAATGHTEGDWIVDTEAQPGVHGYKHVECISCQVTLRSEIIPALPDENEDPDHTHSYGSWNVTKNPTCTDGGIRIRLCACGSSQAQAIPATGHTEGSWIVDTAAQPGVNGSKHLECSKCHTTLKSEIIPALPTVTEPEGTTPSEPEDTAAPEDTTAPEGTTAPEDTTVPEDTTAPTPVLPNPDMTTSPSLSFAYAGFADVINGVTNPNGWDGVYGYRTGEVGSFGMIVTKHPGVSTVDNKITFSGAALVNGGQDGLYYSFDGKNWLAITDVQFSSAAGTALGLWATTHGGLADAHIVEDNGFYTATIDLSAYEGSTVDVYVAVRSKVEYNGTKHLCHLFTFTDVTVGTAVTPEDTTTTKPSAPSEPVSDGMVDLSTLEGVLPEYPDAGYHSPIIQVYDSVINLGYIDLSAYDKIMIQYGCDGTDITNFRFAVLNGNIPIGIKSTPTTYGTSGNYVMDGDIAHTDMVFSPLSWATGARWAEIDLKGINYAGDVYVALHNPDGTMIAISAIKLIPAGASEEETVTRPSNPSGPSADSETMVTWPSNSFPYNGHVDFINGAQHSLNAYRTNTDPLTCIVPSVDGITLGSDCRLTLTGWALVNGGQDKYFWSVDGINWFEFTGGRYSNTGPEHAEHARVYENANVTSVDPTNGVFEDMFVDLSDYRGRTINVYVAVRSRTIYNGVQHLCHFLTLNNVTVPENRTAENASTLPGIGTGNDPYVIPADGFYQITLPAGRPVYLSCIAPAQGTYTLSTGCNNATFSLISSLTGQRSGPINSAGILTMKTATAGERILIEIISNSGASENVTFTVSFKTDSTTRVGSGTMADPYIIASEGTYVAELRQPEPALCYRFIAKSAGTMTIKITSFATDGQVTFYYNSGDYDKQVFVDALNPEYSITLANGESVDFLVDQLSAQPGDITFTITFSPM